MMMMIDDVRGRGCGAMITTVSVDADRRLRNEIDFFMFFSFSVFSFSAFVRRRVCERGDGALRARLTGRFCAAALGAGPTTGREIQRNIGPRFFLFAEVHEGRVDRKKGLKVRSRGGVREAGRGGCFAEGGGGIWWWQRELHGNKV
jgi:hypothetical protein